MPRVLLTAKTVGTLPVVGVQTDYFDTGANCPGFGIRVAASTRTWFLLYRDAHGKLKRFKVGTYPPLSLADARDVARKQLRGVQVGAADPSAAREARRTADTIGDLAEHYIELYAKLKKKSWAEDRRQLRAMVLPVWRNRPASEIRRADVSGLLATVASTRGGVTANRLKALLSKLFAWAVDTGRLETTPIARLPKPATEQSRERELRDEEIRALWSRLEVLEQNKTIDPPVALGLRVRLLTAQRGETVARMRWIHVDLDRAVWDIPGADMKAGKPHIVPLAATVVKLLKARRAVARKDAVYVMEGGRDRRQRRGVIELLDLEDFQPRDLRRTAASGMARAGVSRFIVSRVLGHVDDSITGVYDRYEYLHEKRAALDAWARALTAILSNKKPRASVVPFTRGR